MYQGSHARAKKHSRIRMNKLAILFIAVVMLIGAAVGTTVAFLVTNTESVTNNFTYGNISTEITEDFDYTTKSNVKVKNTGDIPVYVRATYIITWRDADGNIVPTPDGYSYDLTGVTGTTKWVQGKNGYYYYTEPVAPNGGKTEGSLLTCTTKQPAGGEYSLHVEVVAESIQSDPANAITEAWGVTPPNWN